MTPGFIWQNFSNPAEFNDSDGDGFPDQFETSAGSGPNDPTSSPISSGTDGTLSATGTNGDVIIVDQTGNGDFLTIQDAINAVQKDYTTIVVNDGVYYGSIAISYFKVLVKSENGAASTTIDLNQQAAGIYVNSDSVISGFTIKNGHGGLNGITNSGGGIFVDQCAPLFTRCLITRNQADNGAAVYNNFGMPTFVNCTIMGNHVTSGGGAYIYSAGYKPIFVNSIVDDNTSASSEWNSTGIQASYSSIAASGTSVLGVNNISGDPSLTPDGHLASASSGCVGKGMATGGGLDLETASRCH